MADIRRKPQEHLVCLELDGANRLLAKRIVSIGTLTMSVAHPREIFVGAIADRAASIILLHNHPSGSLAPSRADQETTDRIRQAGELLGIYLVDHIIVTTDNYRAIL